MVAEIALLKLDGSENKTESHESWKGTVRKGTDGVDGDGRGGEASG